MKKAAEILGLITWTVVLIALLFIALTNEAKRVRKTRDEKLIKTFSRLSDGQDIKDAYNRATEN